MVGLLHHQLGDFGRRLAAADARYRAAAARGAMHDAGVEFDDAFFVGQATVADGVVLGILFVDIDAGYHGVERIVALLEHFHCARGGPKTVGARNDDILAACGAGLSAGRGQRRAGNKQIASADHKCPDPFRNNISAAGGQCIRIIN